MSSAHVHILGSFDFNFAIFAYNVSVEKIIYWVFYISARFPSLIHADHVAIQPMMEKFLTQVYHDDLLFVKGNLTQFMESKYKNCVQFENRVRREVRSLIH